MGSRIIEVNNDSNKEWLRLNVRPASYSLKQALEGNLAAKTIVFFWCEPGSVEEFHLQAVRPQTVSGLLGWTLSFRSSEKVRECWQRESNDFASIVASVEATIQSVGANVGVGRAPNETFHALPKFGVETWAARPSHPIQANTSDKDSGSWPDTERNSMVKNAEFARVPGSARETFGSIPVMHDSRLLEKKDSFTGSLTQIEIANIIQSIRSGNLSGRLKIRRKSSYINIFFEDGKPMHAEGSRGIGEDSFLQALCWVSGDFEFEPRVKTSERSIFTALDRLLLSGANLKECTEYLKQMGLHMESLLRCKGRVLTERELEERLPPNEYELEKKVYRSISNSIESVQDVVEEFWLIRSTWVLVLANLLKAELIEPFIHDSSDTIFGAKQFDSRLITDTQSSLSNPETGLLTFPSFLYHLNLHFKYAPDTALAIILVGFLAAKDRASSKSSMITSEGFSMLASEIVSIESFSGLVGHYESGIGVALFNSPHNQARRMAKKIFDALPPSTLELAMASVDTTQVGIGLAHYPEEASDLPVLLGAAEAALSASFRAGGGIVFARDL